MEKSKVYFTDLRTKDGDNLLKKLQRLIKKAGIETIGDDSLGARLEPSRSFTT